MIKENWFEINRPDEIDSPALLIYKDRVARNIDFMIEIAGDPKRLVPHVKTHKMAEIVRMQMTAGIERFKCATIAETEMLVKAGALNILLAYQLIMPKVLRWITLVKNNPQVEFASLVDNIDSAKLLNDLFDKEKLTANVFIDVDAGMHRTGIDAGNLLFELYKQVSSLKNINCKGLHVYDGHLREENFELRKEQCESGFKGVTNVVSKIVDAGLPKPMIIAGGTPSFTIHALHPEIYCSPGTCLLWDSGYGAQLKEQPFIFAAVLLTRIISKPQKGVITTDLGHKSVGAENPISKRISFLNLENYTVKSQSEEHLVVEVQEKDWDKMKVGDVLYGVPYHVCPSVALYDEAYIIENGDLIDKWNIEARRKRITV